MIGDYKCPTPPSLCNVQYYNSSLFLKSHYKVIDIVLRGGGGGGVKYAVCVNSCQNVVATRHNEGGDS
jgi:hypothetical protein